MTVSTHVLDAVHGTPVQGMALRLERLDGGGSVPLREGATNADGDGYSNTPCAALLA